MHVNDDDEDGWLRNDAAFGLPEDWVPAAATFRVDGMPSERDWRSKRFIQDPP